METMSERKTKTPSPPKLAFATRDDSKQAVSKLFGEARKTAEERKVSAGSRQLRVVPENRVADTAGGLKKQTRSTPLASGNWRSIGSSAGIMGGIQRLSGPLEDINLRLKRLESSGLLQKFRNSSCIEISEEDEEESGSARGKTETDARQSVDKSNQRLPSSARNGLQPIQSRVVLPKVGSFWDHNKVAQRLFHDKSEEAKDSKLDLGNSSNEATPVVQKTGMRACKSEPDVSLTEDELDGCQENKRSKIRDGRVKACSAKVPRSHSASRIKRSEEHDLKSIQVNGKTYYVLNMLGEGGSSKVYQVYEPVTQETLALKVVYLAKADESTRKGFKNEINMLLKLRGCKRVVRLHDYQLNEKSQQLVLIMEKGDSDLNTVLKQFIETDGLDPHIIKHYWKEMLKAVDEIHQLGVVHSDLKPLNFISVGGKLKLIDFGISNVIETDHTSVMKETPLGTINYMAPECLLSRPYMDSAGSKSIKSIKFNCKADIWSLGCILYNLVYGKPPFGQLPSVIAKMQAICDSKYPIKYPAYENPLVVDCIKRCLQREPNLRPSAEELLRHAYLNEEASKGCQKSGLKDIFSQINNLTPNRIAELSKMLNRLAKE